MRTYLTSQFSASVAPHGLEEHVQSNFAATPRVATGEARRVMDAFARQAVEAGLEVQVAYEELLEHLALLNEGFDEETDRDLILVPPSFRAFRASFEFADALTYLRSH